MLVSAEGPCNVGWLRGGEAQQETSCSGDAVMSSRLLVEDNNMRLRHGNTVVSQQYDCLVQSSSIDTTQDDSQGSEYDDVDN